MSDAIVDATLSQDKYSRVAVETMATKNFIALAGEVTTKGELNYKSIAQKVIKELGYTLPELHFSYKSPVVVKIHTQSSEIAHGVNQDGAGDQGMMFGYACEETKELMPIPIQIAHRLAEKIDEARKKKIIPYLRPDGKTQTTVSYNNGKSVKIEEIVLAVPHEESIQLLQVKDDLYKKVVIPVLKQFGFSIEEKKCGCKWNRHLAYRRTGIRYRGYRKKNRC